MKFWARTIAVMIASIAVNAMSHAAELTVLASQGNLPGLNELATAFARVGYSGDFGGSWFLTQLIGTARARANFSSV